MLRVLILCTLLVYAPFSLLYAQSNSPSNFPINSQDNSQNTSKTPSSWSVYDLIRTSSQKLTTSYNTYTKDIFPFDLRSDYSLQKYINPDIWFDTPNYIPSPFAYIDDTYVILWARNTLRQEAALALAQLSQSFFLQFKKKLYVASAYRTYGQQLFLYNQATDKRFVAKAWHSEHQAWLAIDMLHVSNEAGFFSDSDRVTYYERLDTYAHIYGFHNTYQKWPIIDWYHKEPRHRRYVWAELATLLKNANLTLWQYYAIMDDTKRQVYQTRTFE